MAEAARATDLYQGMVASGAVATRAEAKVGILGAMYGGTRGESGRMLPRLTRRYPRAIGLVEEAARAGERGDVVHTLLGRGSPVPTGSWAQSGPDLGEPADDGGSRGGPGPPPPLLGPVHPQLRRPGHRPPSGRCAGWPICATGSGGWATGTLHERPHLVFFLHDEVRRAHPGGAGRRRRRRRCAAPPPRPGRLLFGGFPVDFPLDVAVVGSWADAG